MTAPSAMTYDSLVDDIIKYTNRANDAVFVAEIPRFIMYAENRLCSEAHGLGFVRVVNFSLENGNPVLKKPARWRETKSFQVTIPTTNSKAFLFNRSLEYCMSFWPNASAVGFPRYYADYDYEHFYIVATPAADYLAQLSYYERPEPLSTTNQTSWTTQYAPQLLLYASLLEASPFLKNPEQMQIWQGLYDRALSALAGEGVQRLKDQSETRK